MTDGNDDQGELQHELFQLMQYMAASAEGLRDEPGDYGSLRLLEVLKRMARIASREYDDDFLDQVAQDIENNKDRVMIDREEFYRFINDLVIDFTREARECSSE